MNVVGPPATTQALLPHFRSARTGTIVNISPLGGRIALSLGALYHASKFAAEGLSDALQSELVGRCPSRRAGPSQMGTSSSS